MRYFYKVTVTNYYASLPITTSLPYGLSWPITYSIFGVSENARHENNGPSKSQGVIMQDRKM